MFAYYPHAWYRCTGMKLSLPRLAKQFTDSIIPSKWPQGQQPRVKLHSSVLFWQKHQLHNPEKYCIYYELNFIIGSQYPKNVLFDFGNNVTAPHTCSSFASLAQSATCFSCVGSGNLYHRRACPGDGEATDQCLPIASWNRCGSAHADGRSGADALDAPAMHGDSCQLCSCASKRLWPVW